MSQKAKSHMDKVAGPVPATLHSLSMTSLPTLLMMIANPEHAADIALWGGLETIMGFVLANQNKSSPFWSDLMALLREVLFSTGYVDSEHYVLVSPQVLSNILVMDAHFEARTALLEELVACRGNAVDMLSLVNPAKGGALHISHQLTQMGAGLGRGLAPLPELPAPSSSISSLFQRLDDRKLAFFCRVLALLVYDGRDKIESLYFGASSAARLLEVASLVRLTNTSSSSRNQALLLASDAIWTKLHALLRVIISNPNVPSFEEHETLWMVVSHRVEIVFVLTMLIGGKRRGDAVRRIVRSGVGTQLKQLVHVLNWDPNSEPQSDHVHGPQCQCNVESSFKMQLLRCLHALLDRFELDSSSPSDMELYPAYKELMDSLASSLVTQFVRQPEESPYRYWMASCLEAYHRAHMEQAKRWPELEKHLLDHVVGDGFKCTGALQSSFDLLGEVYKFKPAFSSSTNSTIPTSPTVTPKSPTTSTAAIPTTASENSTVSRNVDSRLIDRARENLVDSNVFLRTLLLNGFDLHGIDNLILPKLMGSVSTATVSQENICCVNTAILFFVLSSKWGRSVESVWNCVKEHLSVEERTEWNRVLEFWERYYAQRGKDRMSLEQGCRVAMHDWRRTVQQLRTLTRASLPV
jgi:hypothetical protein